MCPSETTLVGATTIPVPTAIAGARIADPTVDGILAMVAWYIKDALDARLATVMPAGTITDACPTAHRFGFDPLEPRGHAVKLPTPALYVWWEGEAEAVEWTITWTLRKRKLALMYVFPELPAFDEMVRREGLLNAVASSLHKMSQRQQHQNYLSGRKLSSVLAPVDYLDWKLTGTKAGRFGIDEGPLAERRAAKKSGRDWPALLATFEVLEKIAQPTLDDPADVTHDFAMSIQASDGEGEVAPFMDRVLDAPDGSEDL